MDIAHLTDKLGRGKDAQISITCGRLSHPSQQRMQVSISSLNHQHYNPFNFAHVYGVKAKNRFLQLWHETIKDVYLTDEALHSTNF